MDDALFDRYEERQTHTAVLATEVLEYEMELDDDEENIDPALVCAHNLCQDNARMKIITGLSIDKFLEVYGLVADVLPAVTGRGPRSKIKGRDRLLMTLCYLKHYETLDKLKDTFHVSRSHLHRVLKTTIAAISPVLYQHYVEDAGESLPEGFEDFPEARYVMDVTFQTIWTPLGTYQERKRFFSGKHKQYGLKTQCIHDRTGRLVHCVSGIPGAVHDLTIARNTMNQVCFHALFAPI